jgi:serine phosphatase RsbU (regulator of sigma subunit)
VRAEIPASKEQHRSVLRNNLQRLLVEIARSLSPTASLEPLIEGLTTSQDHGGLRATLTAYSLAAVFLEYRLLRQTILEVLDEDRPLSATEREAITDALERAMQDAGSQYALVQQDAERKRGDEARTALARERRITEVLQRPLLLKVAEDAFPGLSLATFYEPAWDEAEVGGDFYDAFALAGGKVALVVGDTCGKGLEAAAHNIQVKDVLRALLRGDPLHPGLVLARLNEVVCDTVAIGGAGWDTFTVLSMVVVEPLTGEALFVTAGNEPPLVLQATGQAGAVESHGMALGIEPDQVYAETPARLEVGDTLVMVTDGITEARCGTDLLGYEGMARLARASQEAVSLYDGGQLILDGARAHAGGAFQDDACLILARRR